MKGHGTAEPAVVSRVHELAHEMGLETFASWNEGDWFLGVEGGVARYRSSPLRCLVDALAQPAAVRSEIEAALRALKDLSSSVPASERGQHNRCEIRGF